MRLPIGRYRTRFKARRISQGRIEIHFGAVVLKVEEGTARIMARVILEACDREAQ